MNPKLRLLSFKEKQLLRYIMYEEKGYITIEEGKIIYSSQYNVKSALQHLVLLGFVIMNGINRFEYMDGSYEGEQRTLNEQKTKIIQ